MLQKFLAWDKEYQEMLTVHGIDFDREIVWTLPYVDENSDCGIRSFDDIELMAATGIKDMEGDMIYEGHILESRASENPLDWKQWTVHWTDGSFEFHHHYEPSDKRKKTIDLSDLLCEDHVEFYGLVIVGHVFEEKEE
ncbi:YopX family protein [Streptococcus mutans]|uniref:YopX family protein n=1 Tax=Streptococcus mutans TaxID=1309 RepID=UPI0028E598B1|nr:YopX family protein [Streptococcus mutans]MDT9554896.1 YopX family protein [Streptococcus mutans]MDT9574542.1 YopX family protein [Streptococcus mutans]MDT9578099.1 YopX family protein [Streptococcus mutans]